MPNTLPVSSVVVESELKTENSIQEIETNLKQLQHDAAPLEPTEAEFDQMGKKFTEFAKEIYRDLNTAKGFQEFTPNDFSFGSIEQTVSENPTPVDETLQRFKKNIYENGLKANSPYYMAYVPGGGVAAGAWAHFLTAVANPFMGSYALSPALVKLQNSLIAWLSSEMGLPPGAAGDLTSGGSMAMTSAIAIAREAYNITTDKRTHTIYLTDQTHHSVEKAIKLTGLEHASIRRKVPTDAHHRMDTKKLAEMIASDKAAGHHPWMVVASAGTTNTSAVDKIADIADITDREKMWLQVDGALGALFRLCPRGKEIITGLERADALTMDPHKTLFQQYGMGALIVNNYKHGDPRKLMQKAFGAKEAVYMEDSKTEDFSPSDMSPELSREPRALVLWLVLQAIGIKAFRAALEEKILLADYFAKKLPDIKIPGVTIEVERGDLHAAIFKFKPVHGNTNQFNEKFAAEIRHMGDILLATTELSGEKCVRFICGLRAHQEHVDMALKVIEKAALKVANEMQAQPLQTPAFNLKRKQAQDQTQEQVQEQARKKPKISQEPASPNISRPTMKS